MKPIVNLANDNSTYVPLEDLIRMMKETYVMNYPSVFSFMPLIHKMNDRVQSTQCEMTAAMIPQIQQLETALQQNEGDLTLEIKDSIDGLTKMFLPAMYFEGQYGFVCPPFVKEFLYETPALQELRDKEKWLVR